MDTAILIIQIFAGIIGALLALISISLFFPFRWPAAVMWGLKVCASALSPVFLFTGLIILVIGITTGSTFIAITGAYVLLVYLIHLVRVTRPPAGEFERVFGVKWRKKIKPVQRKYFLTSRNVLKLPAVPAPRLKQDITFATIPGTDRKLLCDIWQPPASIKSSGIAFIFMHGSAFYILDKDCGTRTFFKHLAAQGHVIMDIAYRLAPETDLMGMIHDVKRAILWMKANSNVYGVDPHQIIVGGGSSGGYLALMAAFTADHPGFTPDELDEADLNVCGVVAVYPATDLEALYYHTNQHLTTRPAPGKTKMKVPTEMPGWLKKRLGKDFYRFGMDKGFESVGIMAPLIGGHPDECPERYKLFSPVTHVTSNCPPTLLIHGAHDIMAPVKSTRLLYDRLVKERVPAVIHILPQTDHAFDMFMPNIAPATHNAIYDIERFLALMNKTKKLKPGFMASKENISV
ncbi:MAG TPA: alpha/beta hydrolase [Chitinophagaceae bacterium]|nr:alpha/beta hydrolase [Chitinophagaceae bacterium]